jgi:competence protein ComEA
MKLTSEEKAILITICIAAVAGLIISFIFSYNKKIEVKERLNAPLFINLNTASAEDFDKLPGIGRTIALRIIADRKKLGAFKSTEDIKRVKGITDKKFEKIKKYLIVTEE